jgi:hypothetical protein
LPVDHLKPECYTVDAIEMSAATPLTAAEMQDGVFVVLKYIAAVSLTIAASTPVALADDVSDAESARANARANAYGNGSWGEQRPKLRAQPRSYEMERALRVRAAERARAQAAAAARAKLQAAEPTTPVIKPAVTTETTAAPKEDLQQTTVITKSPNEPAKDAPAAATCHKYSPAVGGMVDVPC